MCETLFNHLENNPSILDDIWFNDEIAFHLSGRVNEHNIQIWVKENPETMLEKKGNSPKLVVWCEISAKGIIGSHFFRDDQRRTTTITEENYLEMV